MQCPQCQSPAVRVDRRFEPRRLFFSCGYYCRECGIRFYGPRFWRWSNQIRRALLTSGISRTVEFLGRRAALTLVACLAVVLTGLSVFFLSTPERNGEHWVGATRPVGEEEPPHPNTVDMGRAGDRFPEISTEAEVPSRPGIDSSPSMSEIFNVRVGSFRNLSNAERVVESLQIHAMDVRTEVTPTGLHAVVMGPFAEEGAAVDAARSVQELTGLLPQVRRLDR